MFDLILENADVMDGSGKQSYKADVGIKGAAIEKIGDLKGAGAAKRVDVSGKTVCPGFIDVHSHADLTFFREDHPRLLSPLVRQGITTFVGGNCGMALAPITEEHRDGQQTYLEVFTQMDFERDIHWDTMGSFMDHMDKEGILLNAALLAPHGMMRISAMGLELGLAGKEDIAYMTRSLEESLEAGVFGLSTGLQYPPGLQSDTPELVELGKPLKRYGGIFASHLRSYTNATLPQAIDEVAEVAQKNDIRGQVSHIFSIPWLGWMNKPALVGLKWLANHAGFTTKVVPDSLIFLEMKKILKQLDSLRGKDIQIGMDIMPTTAGFTHLMAFFPMWALTGGGSRCLPASLIKRSAKRCSRT